MVRPEKNMDAAGTGTWNTFDDQEEKPGPPGHNLPAHSLSLHEDRRCELSLFTCFSLSCASTGTAWSHTFHRCTSWTNATIGFKQELSLSWLVFASTCISSPWVAQRYLLSSQGSLHPPSLPLTPTSFFPRLLMVWTEHFLFENCPFLSVSYCCHNGTLQMQLLEANWMCYLAAF